MSYTIQNFLLVPSDRTQQDDSVLVSPHGTVSVTSPDDPHLAREETLNSNTLDSTGNNKPSMRRKKFQQKQDNNSDEQSYIKKARICYEEQHIKQNNNANEQSHTRQSNISNELLYYEQESTYEQSHGRHYADNHQSLYI